MKRISRNALLLLATICATAALAQSAGGEFSMTRSVLGGGGGLSSGDGFSVTGTIGQAATVASQGGSFSVSGGFWIPGQRQDELFRDGFEE